MNTFHNTASESGQELKDCENKAAIQEQKVLELCLSNPDSDFTSDEVHKAMVTFEYKTSTRRCISNLKNKGLLVDTEKRRKGDSNRNQIVWRLNKLEDLVDMINQVDEEAARKAKFHKKLLKLKKEYLDIMPVDMVIVIDLETV